VTAAAAAAALAVLVTAVEYFFRHFVLFWMPTLGRLNVNDMLALALAYSLLAIAVGAAARVHWRQELRAVGQALRELATQWAFIPWILLTILSLVLLSLVDQRLWAGVRVPMWVASYRNPAAWLASAAPLLNAVAVVAVNGVLVPVAEEFLWRGQIQAHLRAAFPLALAIGVTATLFSLKHVIVDASWGRFLTLVAFGAICGIVAARNTWRTSAALHLFVNLVTTVVALF